MTQQVLVIDDEADIGELIVAVVDMLGHEGRYTTHFKDFKAAFNAEISLVMVDLMMPGTDGIELLRYLQQQACRAGVILMSGFDQRLLEAAEQTAKALGLQVLGCLQKPLRIAELETRLEQFLGAESQPSASHAPVYEFSDAELRQALQEQAFVAYYQPQINLRTNKVSGVEALVRWQHPVHGLIAPDSFIGRLEKLGLIDELTWQVMTRMLADSQNFRTQRFAPSFSVNVSTFSLHDLRLPEQLTALAETHQISLSRLVVEITESGLIAELGTALDILTRLRLRGVQIAIDDFGTGYSMLQQLQHIPATELKIDKSFVQAALSNSSARVLVENTIELGRQLGLRVVAEGVETEASLRFLRNLGCDLAQGYFFTKPLDGLALCDWVKAWSESVAKSVAVQNLPNPLKHSGQAPS